MYIDQQCRMALEEVDRDGDDVFDTEMDFDMNDEFFPEDLPESLNEEDSH